MRNLTIVVLFISFQSFSQTIHFKRVVPEKIKKDSIAVDSTSKSKLINISTNYHKDNPLYMVDGKIVSHNYVKKITADRIESVTILKDTITANAIHKRKTTIAIITKKTTSVFQKKE